MTDIQIANSVKPKKIKSIAAACGVSGNALELYGDYKAKLNVSRLKKGEDGSLVLVTAINPTPLGEGKTTVSIGLADGLRRIGKNAGLALREPSLGPVFGIKGGATGGGYAQVVPMEDINLHFTGDMAAITAANNLLSAVVDNHIFQGNTLDIDTERIVWRRCMDLNDRALRFTEVGLGSSKDGVPRKDGFDITAASEVMAILCLAMDMEDLKKRLGNILVAYTHKGKPVYCRSLKAHNAMAILLKDALKPNLIQTLEGTPALMHGGPFANIAHGCNSIIATRAAMGMFDYTITEAGFGADLGAEKFLNIKSRLAGLKVSAVVIVATIKALKFAGGAPKDTLANPNPAALKSGLQNLYKHIQNIKDGFGLNCTVAINRYATDTDEEIAEVRTACEQKGVKAFDVTVWANGGAGAELLAQHVAKLCSQPARQPQFTYLLEDSIQDKIWALVKNIYGGASVSYSDTALAQIKKITAMGGAKLPIVVAKTQYSLSQDAKLTGRPEGFDFNVKSVYLRSGAGFVVVVAGSIMLMPGLPKQPASDGMEIRLKRGKYDIKGLF